MTRQKQQRTTSTGKKKDESRGRKSVLLIFLILLLLLLWFIWLRKPPVTPEIPPRKDGVAGDSVPADTTANVDSITAFPDTVDTVVLVDTVTDNIDTVAIQPVSVPKVKDTIQENIAGADDTTGMVDDSTDVVSDTTIVDEDPCLKDTAALWVYPDPSGGLHYRMISVEFVANRNARIHYKMNDDTSWMVYDGKPVAISSTTTLYFDAIDSCGRVMEQRAEYYEIEKGRKTSPCDTDMAYIKVGSMRFCMDRYEWPNHKGVRPQSFVSYYQAMDSCFSVDKRLCTAEEWTVACGGSYSYTYPYGNSYEPYGCVTHDTMTALSGSKPECRSFFGVFDMSGNLLEWTSTKARENSAFYYVAGGFWESGPKSGCGSRRYSYYPQNKHNPVGFRCCRDISTKSPGGSR